MSITKNDLSARTREGPDETASVDDTPVSDGFTPAQRGLHWAVVLLVAVQIPLGVFMWRRMSDPAVTSGSNSMLLLHGILGALILGVMLRRLQLRRLFGTPPPPVGTPLDTSAVAKANHQAFYAILLVMPFLGLAAVLSGVGHNQPNLFGAMHRALAYVLVAAIGAHLLGVAYHMAVRRDGLLGRMIGGRDT